MPYKGRSKSSKPHSDRKTIAEHFKMRSFRLASCQQDRFQECWCQSRNWKGLIFLRHISLSNFWVRLRTFWTTLEDMVIVMTINGIVLRGCKYLFKTIWTHINMYHYHLDILEWWKCHSIYCYITFWPSLIGWTWYDNGYTQWI